MRRTGQVIPPERCEVTTCAHGRACLRARAECAEDKQLVQSASR